MRNEMGLCLSTLYPTIYPLYQELGWTLAEDAHRYIGAPTAFCPSSLLPVDPGGRLVQRAVSSDDVELLEPVYRQFARPRSGYLDRPRWYWEDHVLRHQRASQPRWVTLWYGADNALSAYVLYTLNYDPDERQLRVYELVSIRPEGYQALLTFLSSHHLWDKVVIEDGHDVPWKLLVANPHSLDVKTPITNNHFLLRIVDLQQAIARTVPPSELQAPDIALRVCDRVAPWNDGIWTISQRNGQWSCDQCSSREPDAAVDISVVAPLVAGSLSVQHAMDTGLLQASTDAKRTLSSLFAQEYRPHSKDHF
jgi:predicted acetyltransferase